jgi:hypothetical protein
MMATLARFQGVLFSGVFLWLYLIPDHEARLSIWEQIRFAIKNIHWPRQWSILWGFLPVAAWLSWHIVLQSQSMETPTHILPSYWDTTLVYPWVRVLTLIQQLLEYHTFFFVSDYLNLAAITLALVGAVIGLWKLPGAFSLYIWGTLAILLTRNTPPYPITGFSRFALHLLPLFFLAIYLPKRIYRIVQAGGFISQVFFLSAFLKGVWIA